jgi:polyhydroxybutyrate depolymerase
VLALAVLLVSLVLVLHPAAHRSASPPGATAAPGTLPLPPEGVFEGRPFRLFTPDRPPARLVVALHPLYGNPGSFETLTRLDRFAAERGWAVLYPAGLHGSWNAGVCCGFARRNGVDDVGYVLRLIRSTRNELSFGSQPTDLMGYSNGGMLALAMMCDAPSEVSAVAVVAGNLQAPSCGGAKPFLMIRGASDTTVPPAGGPSSTAQAILFPDFVGLRLILHAARCRPQVVTGRQGRVESSTVSCGGRVLGTYLRLRDVGHGYPSASPFDATARIVDFLGRQP